MGIAVVAALIIFRAAGERSAPAPAPTNDLTGPTRYVNFTEDIMASPVRVRVPVEAGEDAAGVVFDIFRDVDARMSEWKPTSPLSAVNLAAGAAAVEVPADLRLVLKRGIAIGDQTGGAYDLTWAALWGLWDFKAASPIVPDDDELRRRLALVDYRRVEIDDAAGTVRLPEIGMVIGLGGIAKGYALDEAARTLRARGVESFLLTAGGQVMAGAPQNGGPWHIGIRDPRGAPDDYFAILSASDVSVSTSGDYERYFVRGGVRYHHILDPRTGRPARGVRSATVISADATLADALSTALIVMGIDRALALVESLDGVEVVMVDDAAQVHTSRGITDNLRLVHWPAIE